MTRQPPSHARLWLEFVVLFGGVPVAMALFFEFIAANRLLFSVVWALAGVAAVLLLITPGFRFARLWRGPVLREWRIIVLFWISTVAASLAFVFAIDPDMFLSFARARPGFWLAVMIAYPVFSAWPQELIFRSLFFERYGALFPNATVLIMANGLVFGFGHLFYMNWVTIGMTAFGGAFMGWAYLRHRSMLFTWVLHSLAGQIIFTAGLGRFFYHGAI